MPSNSSGGGIPDGVVLAQGELNNANVTMVINPTINAGVSYIGKFDLSGYANVSLEGWLEWPNEASIQFVLYLNHFIHDVWVPTSPALWFNAVEAKDKHYSQYMWQRNADDPYTNSNSIRADVITAIQNGEEPLTTEPPVLRHYKQSASYNGLTKMYMWNQGALLGNQDWTIKYRLTGSN